MDALRLRSFTDVIEIAMVVVRKCKEVQQIQDQNKKEQIKMDLEGLMIMIRPSRRRW